MSDGKDRVKENGISFHGFPKEAHLRAAWLKALGKQESHLLDSAVVCSQHFLYDDICETESGLKLLRRGAVPSTVQVCMMCLDTDSQMFLMRKHKFDEAYEKITGLPLCDGRNLKQTLCVQCAQRLKNFSRFREQSLRVRSLMIELFEKHKFVTINHIRMIKRKLNNDFAYHYDLYKVESEEDKKKIFGDSAGVKNEFSDDSMWDFDDMETNEEFDDAGPDSEVFFELPSTCTKYDPLSTKLQITYENEDNNIFLKTEHRLDTNDDELNQQELSENKKKDTNSCLVEVKPKHDGEREETLKSYDIQTNDTASKDLYNQSIDRENEKNECKLSETFHWESDFSDCTLSSISWGDECYTCDICQKTFKERKLLIRHIKTHTDTGEKSLSCNYCSYKFKCKSHLEKHMRSHTGGKLYSCKICSKEFTIKRSLQRHLNTHDAAKHLFCKFCPYKTSRPDHLLNHVKIHTGEKRFACELCKYKFAQNSDLVKHMRTHTGEKPFSCEYCDKKFAKKNTLTRHILRIHTRPGETPFSCSMCDFKCWYESRLVKHTKTHAVDRTYSCRLCEYTCKSETQLKWHTKTHTTEKYFACDFCDYTVNFKSELIRHIRTHTGEKAFMCQTCKRRFAEKSKLTRHMKIHTGEKPFACTLCTYRCIRKCNLENHMKTHTRENRFSCDLCTFKCARISALNRHMRTHK